MRDEKYSKVAHSRWQSAGCVARRELLEFVRDRRTLVITLLLPMICYPILALATTLGLRKGVMEAEARLAATKVVVVVSGPDAHAFIERMQKMIDSTDPSEENMWPAETLWHQTSNEIAQEAMDTGAADLWVHAKQGMMAALDKQGTVAISVGTSTIRPPSQAMRKQFVALMSSFNDEIRKQRIATAGLPETVLEPIEMQLTGEIASGQLPLNEIMNTVAGGVLVLLAVLTMTGAFYPAIDAIAGEKERGTIETLLIAPCSAQEIVFGKFLAVFAITLLTLAANVTSIAATSAVSLRVLADSPSQALAFATASGIVLTLIVFVGLASVGAATCLAVTTAAKSGKEAQNTLTPVIILVSALAGAALLPGMQDNRLLPAVPFVGHVLVSQAAFAGVEARGVGAIALPLFLSLASSVFVTWLLLRVTAVMLADEDTLFRGQDSASPALTRPNRRVRPTLVQGAIPPIMGLAALWYAQAFMPKDLLTAIPATQVATVLLPLGLLLWWQRVDIRQTFSLYWPGTGHGLKGSLGLIGAGLLGGGTFIIGAAALVAFGGETLTQQAQDLSRRIVQLILGQEWWLSWLLVGVIPAVCEEFLFRGWTLSAFAGSRKTSGRVAIAVFAQAFLFAIAHVLPERMPQTFILGVLLGWITIATGSILPAIIGHMVHNSMPLAMLLTSGYSSEELLAASTNEMPGVGSTNIPLWAVLSAAVCIVIGVFFVESAGRKKQG